MTTCVDCGWTSGPGKIHGSDADGKCIAGTPGEKSRRRSFNDLLTSGLLWLINRVVFHPRGLALAFHIENGVVLGWSLIGDGQECWNFDGADDNEGFASSTKTIQEHLAQRCLGDAG